MTRHVGKQTLGLEFDSIDCVLILVGKFITFDLADD